MSAPRRDRHPGRDRHLRRAAALRRDAARRRLSGWIHELAAKRTRKTRGGGPGPIRVDRYLLPREVPVVAVRKHPAVLIPPAAMALAGLLAAGALSATILQHHKVPLAVVWLLCAFLVARLIWKAANWSVDYFVVTDNRMFQTSGFFTRNIGAVSHTKVTDLTFRRSSAGRLLGYGELIVETAAVDQALSRVDYIPHPEAVYLRVCKGILFPDRPGDDGDDL